MGLAISICNAELVSLYYSLSYIRVVWSFGNRASAQLGHKPKRSYTFSLWTRRLQALVPRMRFQYLSKGQQLSGASRRPYVSVLGGSTSLDLLQECFNRFAHPIPGFHHISPNLEAKGVLIVVFPGSTFYGLKARRMLVDFWGSMLPTLGCL